jgi:hypothetical protein
MFAPPICRTGGASTKFASVGKSRGPCLDE